MATSVPIWSLRGIQLPSWTCNRVE